MNTINQINTLLLSADCVRKMIEHLAPVVSQIDPESLLGCINLQARAGLLVACATDACRLVTLTEPFVTDHGEANINLPLNLVQALAKAPKRSITHAKVELCADDTTTFDMGSFHWEGRSVKAEYPRYQELFPVDIDAMDSFLIPSTETSYIGELHERMSQLDYLMVQLKKLVKADVTAVKLTISEPDKHPTGYLTVGTSDDWFEFKGAQRQIKCMTSAPLTIGFNPSFLIQALKHKGAIAHFTQPLQPVVFTYGNDVRHLLMPVSLRK